MKAAARKPAVLLLANPVSFFDVTILVAIVMFARMTSGCAPAKTVLTAVCLAFAAFARATASTNALSMESVVVDGKTIPFADHNPVSLGPFPVNIVFGFGPDKNAVNPPLRLRYMLEGYEKTWHEAGGEMGLTVRFYNHAGDQLGQNLYPVHGESTGWTGSLENSALTHRRETLLVPPHADRLLVVISSAGPPDSVGIYIVADLVVSKTGGTVLLRSPFDNEPEAHAEDDPPAGWMHDGLRLSIARVVKFGQDPQTRAFAVLDEDLNGHGEWHNILESAPVVTPGDRLVVEWNEMYSIGLGSAREAHYEELPAGNYQFRVAGTDVFGRLTGVESGLNFYVPQPFWKTPWFWGLVVVGATAMILGASRYFVWHKMRREMVRLKHQRALVQERLRIAHDIHDDLGARVTQISLLSAMAQDNTSFPEKARADFDKITKMARALVAALYETVWAVNPENDNLEALGSYLCQMANKMCEQTPLRCRFYMTGLPPEVQVSSQTRHNISMAMKEAIHNVIKHAQASEISMRMKFTDGVLDIAIEDDGKGFEPAAKADGNGLSNMKRRLANIGGQCDIASQPGKGTTVRIHLQVRSFEKIP
jgi:signal transduction histidine kinase